MTAFTRFGANRRENPHGELSRSLANCAKSLVSCRGTGLERFVNIRTFMRLAIPVSLVLAVSMSGCLQASHSQDNADLADYRDDPNHPADPATGPASGPEGPADLAGSVHLDGFASTGTSAITLSDATATLRLNESKTITVTINGNGASGSATLALTNAPPGLTATFNPATVTVGASPVTTIMTVTSTTDMDPANSVAATLSANIAGATSTTTIGITVMPEVLIHIPKGVALTSNPTAFGAAAIPMKLIGAGTKITFVNEDGIEHRIHASGTNGLAHEPTNMGANGGTYTQTITAAGTLKFNCHIHAGMTGSLVVQ